MLRKWYILVILVIGVSFVTVPIFAEEIFPYDSDKGTDYYLDRYYNELAYKEWFDTNYPDITIEEGIGLVKPYSDIVDNWEVCKSNVQYRYDGMIKSYISSGGDAIGAELNVPYSYFELLWPCIETNLQPLNDVGAVLANRGLLKESIPYYDKALDLFPNYIEALWFEGRTYAELGDYEKATSLYDKIVEIDPTADLSSEREFISNRLENQEVEPKIPEWVRNIFVWYGEEKISDDELLGAIQFLLDEGILKS